jgi:hypothetical protein
MVSEADELRVTMEGMRVMLEDCRRKFEVQRDNYELALGQLRERVRELEAALANRVG